MKFAKFISYFFHPVNFPLIGALLYFFFIPKHISKGLEYTILLVIFIGSYVFPLILLALLKRFSMIKSYHMANIEERKYPTILFIALALVIANWLRKLNIVDLLVLFYVGYAFGLSLSYIFLFFRKKISLHTSAVSGLIAFLILFSFTYKINMLFFIALFFFLAGLIAFARLRLKAHSSTEVFLGFLLGFFSQFIVYLIYYIM